MKADEIKREFITQGNVTRALAEAIEGARAHLDLEGFAYIKITRTGPQSCFASDATSDVLKKDMSYTEIAEAFWKVPASYKWGERIS